MVIYHGKFEDHLWNISSLLYMFFVSRVSIDSQFASWKKKWMNSSILHYLEQFTFVQRMFWVLLDLLELTLEGVCEH